MPMQIPTPPPPPGANVTTVYTGAAPTVIWKGAVAARRELNSQRIALQDQRRTVAQQLRDPMVGGADRQGLEQQIISIDARIAALDKAIADANAQVASTALVPGAVVEDRRDGDRSYIDGSILTALFITCVLLPLSVAFALRLLRRGTSKVTAPARELMERFDRVDQAVEAMAVEVERIGESQRFVTRLLSDRATNRISS